MNQSEFTLGNLPKSPTFKAICSCGKECDCVMKTFSDGTKHAWGTCLQCGKTNAKQQIGKSIELDDLKHKLMGLFSSIKAMKAGVDQDEAICMIERLAEDLWSETGKQ